MPKKVTTVKKEKKVAPSEIEARVFDANGKNSGTIALPGNIFGLSWNADLVHQVVTSMLGNMRPTVAHAKNRGEVRGGGKKPWKQKGTGRARHGSSRSPIWVGGGVTHGPRSDKDYSRKINKKMKRKALAVILSKKFKDGEVLFVESIKTEVPKTKDAKSFLTKISSIKGYEKISKKPKNAALIAFSEKDKNTEKSFSNIGNIATVESRNLNPVLLLNHTYLVVSNPKAFIESIS